MRLIAVDIGNSASKIGLDFDHQFQPQQTLRWFGDLSESSENSANQNEHQGQNQDAILELIDRFERALENAPDGSSLQDERSAGFTWAVCSVHQPRLEALRHWVSLHRPQDKFLSIKTAHVPFAIDVEFPRQVGLDRLMAAVAASRLRQHDDEAAIVIDAGTAVTIDLLLPDSRFVGGNIFLGADAEFENISSRTDALPRLDYAFRQQRLSLSPSTNSSAQAPAMAPIGKNTIDAILSGVYQSQIGAIEYIVSSVAKTIEGNYRVVGTGGGIAELLQLAKPLGIKFWSEDWTYEAHLVLKGIAITVDQLQRTNADGSMDSNFEVGT